MARRRTSDGRRRAPRRPGKAARSFRRGCRETNSGNRITPFAMLTRRAGGRPGGAGNGRRNGTRPRSAVIKAARWRSLAPKPSASPRDSTRRASGSSSAKNLCRRAGSLPLAFRPTATKSAKPPSPPAARATPAWCRPRAKLSGASRAKRVRAGHQRGRPKRCHASMATRAVPAFVSRQMSASATPAALNSSPLSTARRKASSAASPALACKRASAPSTQSPVSPARRPAAATALSSAVRPFRRATRYATLDVPRRALKADRRRPPREGRCGARPHQ